MTSFTQEQLMEWSMKFAENVYVKEGDVEVDVEVDVEEERNKEVGFQMWIKINLLLEISSNEGLVFVSNLMVEKMKSLIELNKSISLNLIVNTNIMNSLSKIQQFFDFFSSQIPLDKISSIHVFSIPKYIGIANVILTFASKDVRKKMKIYSTTAITSSSSSSSSSSAPFTFMWRRV